MFCILDGCNYYYQKVPTNATNRTCNVMEGGSASFGCGGRGICNTFSVLWFKHTIEGSIRINDVSQTDILRPSDKYNILTSHSQAAANGHCNIGTTLTIYRFNHSDNGYYWCLIVSNNSCLLQPSPRGYVAVDETTNEHSCTFERLLPIPICAENAISQASEEMECISESISLTSIMPTTIGLYSRDIRYHNINSTTTATSAVTLHDNTDFDKEENMVWVYGLVTVFLLVVIVLVLSLVIVSIKYRTQQKYGKHNRCTICIDFCTLE